MHVIIVVNHELLRSRARRKPIVNVGLTEIVPNPHYGIILFNETAVEDDAVHCIVEYNLFVVWA